MRPPVRTAPLLLALAATAAGGALAPRTVRAQPACAFGATLATLIADGGCVLLDRVRLTDFTVLQDANLDPSRVGIGFFGFADAGSGPRGFGVDVMLDAADALTAPTFGGAPNPQVLWLSLRATALDGRRIQQVGAMLDFYTPGVYTLGSAVGWNPFVFASVGAPDADITSTMAEASRGTADGGAESGRCFVNFAEVFCVDATVEADLPVALATTPLSFRMGAGVNATGAPTTVPSSGASLRSAGFTLLLDPAASTVVPEPGTLALLGAGSLMLGVAVRRRRG